MARKRVPLPAGAASFGPTPPRGIGTPVGLITDDLPYGPGVSDPNFIPGNPHNLPDNANRPALRQFVGVAPSSLPSSGPAVPLPTAPQMAVIKDPFHYAKPIEGTANVDAASQLVIPEPATLRNYLMLRNSSPGAQVLFIAFGSDAHDSSTLRLAVNEIVFLDPVPQSDVYCLSSAAGGRLSYAVGTIAQ